MRGSNEAQRPQKKKTLLEHTKGFRWGRKSKYDWQKTRFFTHGNTLTATERLKKESFASYGKLKLTLPAERHNLSYSKFIYGLKQNKIALDRKMLALLVKNHPEIFLKIREIIKK